VLPNDLPAWERMERTARDLARRFGARELRPPILESTELFVRSVGEVSDIVEKEMFTVVKETEKGSSSYTLRPEGTAGIARAYLQAGLAKTQPIQKVFLIGPMFRYERPQKGRERQFTQFDFECIGSPDPRFDAEAVHLAASFFEELGVRALEVRMNSMGDGEDRDRWRDALRAHLAPTIAEHCELCRKRFERNVARVLDCKNPRCQELHADPPRILDHLSAANRAHFDAVAAHLAAVGRDVVVDASIVRGLDYYTHTVFEVVSPELGRALCGGGRYDHLLRDLGGPDLGAVGFAIGFEPTLVVLEELGLLEGLAVEPLDVYVVTTDPKLSVEVFTLADELRRAGLSAVYAVDGRSFKSQMKQVGGGGTRLAAILGPDELAAGTVQLKDLATSEQVTVPRAEVGARARELASAARAAAADGAS